MSDNTYTLNDRDLLTPAQAAQLKKVSRTTIYSAIAEGRLPSGRVVNRLGVRRADLLAWTPGVHSGRPKGIPVASVTRQRMSRSQRKRRLREAAKH